MSISMTALTSGSANDVSSAVTASITPTGNRLQLAWVFTLDAGTPTLTGNGITWVSVATIPYPGNGARATLFRGLVASPTSGAVTIDFGGATQTTILWSIAEFGGVNTSGSNGSGAVVQSVAATDSNTSLILTLAAFGSTANATAGGFALNSNTATMTPGTGFTTIHTVASGVHALQEETQWRLDNATTVDCSWAPTNTACLGIAVEIAASVVPPDDDSWNVTIVQPQETLVSIW